MKGKPVKFFTNIYHCRHQYILLRLQNGEGGRGRRERKREGGRGREGERNFEFKTVQHTASQYTTGWWDKAGVMHSNSPEMWIPHCREAGRCDRVRKKEIFCEELNISK